MVTDTMQARVLLAICVLLAFHGTTVAQSKRWFARELNCWVTQEKVPASWDDARRDCELQGAVLASPLNAHIFNFMQSIISVNNHSASYFIGTRVNRLSNTRKVHYASVEGRRLDDMPSEVFEAIDQLELDRGDCLCMDRRAIRAVSCWDHLPYICYSKESTECGSAPPTTTPTPPTSASTRPTTTSSTTTMATTTAIPSGYTYESSTGSAYKVHPTAVPWHVANATCAADGAHLLVLEDAHEAEVVKHVAHDVVGYYLYMWTGLHDDRVGGLMDWRTVQGERLSTVQQQMWQPGQLKNDARYLCGVLNSYTKLMFNENCHLSYLFTCELTV